MVQFEMKLVTTARILAWFVRSGLLWAALLGAVVVLLYCRKEYAAVTLRNDLLSVREFGEVSGWRNAVAKPRLSFGLPKNIPIYVHAEHVKPHPFTGNDLPNFFMGKGGVGKTRNESWGVLEEDGLGCITWRAVRELPVRWQWKRPQFHEDGATEIVGRRLPMVIQLASYFNALADIQAMNVSRRTRYIGAQLPHGSVTSIIDQRASGDPKQECEKDKQGVGYLEPIAKQRRPELASVFAAMISLWLGRKCLDRGKDYWDGGSRLAGAALRCIGYLLGLSATFGLILGCDLWSLGKIAWSG